MLQHCPAIGVKYKLLLEARRQFESEKSALASRIQIPEKDVFKSFGETAVKYSLRKAKMFGDPEYRIKECGGEFSLQVSSKELVALGNRESIERCKKLHRETVNKYAKSGEISHILELEKRLAKTHEELDTTIYECCLRKEWVSHACDMCPGIQAGK